MKQNKRTLIILIPGFPENESDTTCLPLQQAFVLEVMNSYPDWQVHVLAFQYPYCKGSYQWKGIPVTAFNGRNKGGIRKWLIRFQLDQKLKKIVATSESNLLISFWYGECAWVGKKFAEKNKLRHYCWMMGQDARKENPYPHRLNLKANELIAISDSLRDEFFRNFNIRIDNLIEPGITESRNLDSGENAVRDIHLLAAGSLIPLKRFEIFITAVASLKTRTPGLKAVLIGAGPERQKIESLIVHYGLAGDISCRGELPHPEVLQLMARSKLLLHPSSYEGFSGVCLEAISQGCQVISFCRPVNKQIPQWQIARSSEEMISLAFSLLRDAETPYEKILPYKMKDTVAKIFALLTE